MFFSALIHSHNVLVKQTIVCGHLAESRTLDPLHRFASHIGWEHKGCSWGHHVAVPGNVPRDEQQRAWLGHFGWAVRAIRAISAHSRIDIWKLARWAHSACCWAFSWEVSSWALKTQQGSQVYKHDVCMWPSDTAYHLSKYIWSLYVLKTYSRTNTRIQVWAKPSNLLLYK